MDEEIVITISKDEIEIDYTKTGWNEWMLLNSGIIEAAFRVREGAP